MRPKGWKKALTFAGCSALGAAVIASAVAQDPDNKKSPTADSPLGAFAEQIEGGLKKLLDAIPANESDRKKLDDAFAQLQRAFNDEPDANRAQGNGPNNFQFEWKSGDPEEIQEMLEKLMSEDGLGKLGDFNIPNLFGNPGNPGQGFDFGQLEDLFGDFGEGGGFGDLQKQLEGMFESFGMRGGGGKARLFDLNDMADAWQPNQNGKDHDNALTEYDEVVSTARQSTVRILGKRDKQIAFGTIVAADGHALTKASEVGEGKLDIELADGRRVTAEVLDTMADYDLALIKIDADNLAPANFVDQKLDVGTFLAASGTEETPLAVGALSVAERTLSEKEKGFLGIGMEGTTNVKVTGVTPNSGADRAGVQAGDIVLKVDGQEIYSPQQLMKTIAGKRPADTVNLHLDRKGKAVDIDATLTSRADLPPRFFSGMDMSAAMGGRLSEQRSGYPLAVQHDLTLRPNECGSPLVDLDGNVVGINIARAGRVKSYAIPAKVIIEMMSGLDTPAPRFDKDAAALEREATEADRLLEEAHEALRKAEERAKRAKNSLNKAAE